MRTAFLTCLAALFAASCPAAPPELTLPPRWHGVCGQPLSLYFDNVVLHEGTEKYQYEVRCDVGRTEGARWTATLEDKDAGPHALEVILKDSGGKVVQSATTTLHVAPRDAGAGRKLRLLIVGDSLTHASLYPNEIARLCAQPGNPKVTLLGTHRPASAAPGVAHEGYGGWTWAAFLTKFSPAPPQPAAGPPARKATSPFLFADDKGQGVFDLPRYFREHCENQPPDVVLFLLGINDCFGADPNNAQARDAKINEVLGNAEKLLAAFQKAAPNAVLAVGLTTAANSRDEAFVANYKDRYTRAGWKRIQQHLVARMIRQFNGREAEGVHLLAPGLGVDPVEGYPANNAVHPNAVGYAQLGAGFHAWLKNWLAADAKAVKTTSRYDVLIRNARVVDGTGAPAMMGSIAIKDGKIAALGKVDGTAETVIDARGRVAAPGFIDVHTHSEKICDLPVAENFLRMGVTSIITGNCGYSRTDVAAFFKEIEATGTTLNVATLIGHGAVREEGMGGKFIRAPNAEQMKKMKALVEKAMQDGAVGMSTGLIYVPGSFAKTDEIIELAKVVAAHNGTYASHMRHETRRIFSAMDELTRIAREAGVRAELSHIKLSGPTAWGKAREVLDYLEKARAEGLKITHDQYGYTASSTGLRQTIPDEALEGTRDDFASRLADPVKKAEIIAGMKKILKDSGRENYAYAVVARFPADPSLNGLNIVEAAKKVRGNDSLDDQIELLLDIEKRGGGSGVFHGMNEEDLTAFLKHPLTMIASDGGPRRLGEDVPHPRSYGNNARILARYVREQKVLSLEDAVRKMTQLPARTFRLAGRGELTPGSWADVVIFDPQTVQDKSEFNDPHHYSEGFSDVLVNGVPVIREGKVTDARPGGPLRMAR